MRLELILSDTAIEQVVKNIDLPLRARNTNVLDIVVRDEEGVVVDLTGSTFFFTVKEKISDSDDSAKLKKDVTSHTYPESGQTQITLSATDTTSLLGNYVYSIKIKTTTGLIYTLCEGSVTFQQEASTRTS